MDGRGVQMAATSRLLPLPPRIQQSKVNWGHVDAILHHHSCILPILVTRSLESFSVSSQVIFFCVALSRPSDLVTCFYVRGVSILP